MFRITRENDRFIATGPFPADELEEAGWFVYPTQWKARTARPSAVKPYLEYCDDEARRHVEISQRQLSVEDSWAAEADIDVPCPPGLAYRDYQLAGIKYMSERWGSLNADVPRLGKTIQTIGVMNLLKKTLKVLVICPAIAKIGWEREMLRWAVQPHTVGIAYGNNLPDTDVVILNYELLQRHSEKLRQSEWDIVVCDEAHYLGNPKSKRTKVALALRPKYHFIALTGTPAFTRPIQLWPMVQKLDREDIGKNWMTFTRRYCNAFNDPFGRYNTTGYSNLDELQVKMRKKFMVRREKSDVLDELPPMRKTIYMPADGMKAAIKKERDAFQERYDEFLDAVREGDAEGWLEENGFSADESWQKLRRELALAKVPSVVSYISDLLDSEPKVVVFYHHRDPLDAFYKSFDPKMIARVWGGMTANQREHERVAFQEDDDVRIFVANLQSASTAIELSASDAVVFAEFARAVPSEFDQAEERVWLPTKKTPVEIHNLVVQGSVEADVAEALAYRRGQLERLTCRALL
jgi:SNF2 family DNA or RNA helicase